MLAKTKMLGLMVATAILTSPMLVWADTDSARDTNVSHGQWHQDHEKEMMGKILNLNADQEKQLKESHQKQKEAMKSIFEQMKSNREAFNAEIVKTASDMNKINEIQAQLKAIQSQMLDNHLSSLLEVKKILTPEQFSGYMALEKERMLKHEGHEKMDHKDNSCKICGGHKHDDNKSEKGHDSDDKD